ncbi:MAG: tRNA (N6-threonylcarbamoyladenosine(37)-N6)-methyltransferase TrmO [Deltaproteobacteria bacterium]|nr:tRNA (N6-threonylcarbamoyladenosine(37)-N6)-methyltransferase TrmO [Deltaproteobacteria bacterium]MBW2219274.1 tRNA (N6-threonylcarbamoyladenosine(37)-N6)-methyltransferase TrmO [Deltaproteobacteria bacterium]
MDDAQHKWPLMQLTPIGQVRSEIKTPTLRAENSDIKLSEQMDKIREYHQKVKHVVCEIIIFSKWEELLDGIEGFSHILVLYWPHLIDPERRNLRKVHPMGRKNLPKQGIFATCSPARPNPVLVSAVKLLERHGSHLKVEGLEAVDGSPIVDIKPYAQTYYGAENPIVPAWMAQIQRELEKTVP